jgi:hypothetical protein
MAICDPEDYLVLRVVDLVHFLIVLFYRFDRSQARNRALEKNEYTFILYATFRRPVKVFLSMV